MTFQRPSNVLPTGVQTGVTTPFQRYSNGVPTGCPRPPHTPQALDARPKGLWEAPARCPPPSLATRRANERLQRHDMAMRVSCAFWWGFEAGDDGQCQRYPTVGPE
jgi:hypothetical protein